MPSRSAPNLRRKASRTTRPSIGTPTMTVAMTSGALANHSSPCSAQMIADTAMAARTPIAVLPRHDVAKTRRYGAIPPSARDSLMFVIVRSQAPS